MRILEQATLLFLGDGGPGTGVEARPPLRIAHRSEVGRLVEERVQVGQVLAIRRIKLDQALTVVDGDGAAAVDRFVVGSGAQGLHVTGVGRDRGAQHLQRVATLAGATERARVAAHVAKIVRAAVVRLLPEGQRGRLVADALLDHGQLGGNRCVRPARLARLLEERDGLRGTSLVVEETRTQDDLEDRRDRRKPGGGGNVQLGGGNIAAPDRLHEREFDGSRVVGTRCERLLLRVRDGSVELLEEVLAAAEFRGLGLLQLGDLPNEVRAHAAQRAQAFRRALLGVGDHPVDHHVDALDRVLGLEERLDAGHIGVRRVLLEGHAERLEGSRLVARLLLDEHGAVHGLQRAVAGLDPASGDLARLGVVLGLDRLLQLLDLGCRRLRLSFGTRPGLDRHACVLLLVRERARQQLVEGGCLGEAAELRGDFRALDHQAKVGRIRVGALGRGLQRESEVVLCARDHGGPEVRVGRRLRHLGEVGLPLLGGTGQVALGLGDLGVGGDHAGGRFVVLQRHQQLSAKFRDLRSKRRLFLRIGARGELHDGRFDGDLEGACARVRLDARLEARREAGRLEDPARRRLRPLESRLRVAELAGKFQGEAGGNHVLRVRLEPAVEELVGFVGALGLEQLRHGCAHGGSLAGAERRCGKRIAGGRDLGGVELRALDAVADADVEHHAVERDRRHRVLRQGIGRIDRGLHVHDGPVELLRTALCRLLLSGGTQPHDVRAAELHERAPGAPALGSGLDEGIELALEVGALARAEDLLALGARIQHGLLRELHAVAAGGHDVLHLLADALERQPSVATRIQLGLRLERADQDAPLLRIARLRAGARALQRGHVAVVLDRLGGRVGDHLAEGLLHLLHVADHVGLLRERAAVHAVRLAELALRHELVAGADVALRVLDPQLVDQDDRHQEQDCGDGESADDEHELAVDLACHGSILAVRTCLRLRAPPTASRGGDASGAEEAG